MKIRFFFSATVLLALLGGPGAAQDFGDGPRSAPMTPIYIAIAPGIAIPFGMWDVSIAGAAVGAVVNDVFGLMGAGVFNVAHDVRGLQGAGVFNVAHDVFGVQGAGVFNIAVRVRGAQGAGVFNMAADVAGYQGAGVFNNAADVDGVQYAGVFNIARRVDGMQAAGVFNVAKGVDGLQVGIVNVADRLDGVQIGLVNIARDGVNGFGAVYEPQTGYAWGYWQNGSRFLYSVLSAGLPLQDLGVSADSLVMAAGLGTRFGGRRSWPCLDVELLAAQEIGPCLGALREGMGGLFRDGDLSVFRLVAPYPEFRLRLGLPIFRSVALVAGLTTDFDLADRPNMPANLKTGYSFSSVWFGEAFTAYTRWFIGFRI